MAESTTEFHVRIADESLNFQTLSVSDPVPAGRQLLAAGGFRSPEEHLLFERLNNGALEERRLDEVTDLRQPGPKTFIAFRSDRSFRLVLNDRRFEWGASKISEAALMWLAGIDPKAGGVWLELRDEPDRLLKKDDVIALSEEGTERFRTGPSHLPDTCVTATLNDDVEKKIPSGAYKTEELLRVLGVEAGYVLDVLDEQGKLNPLQPGQSTEVKAGMRFFSHVPAGGSS